MASGRALGAVAAFQRKGETGLVQSRRNAPVGRAAVEDREVLRAAVFHVGLDRLARAVGKTAVSVDLAFEVRLDGEDGLLGMNCP